MKYGNIFDMRLWHYELIKVLPLKQLTGQWRECRAIIGLINKFGNPNSLIVNKVMEYPFYHFEKYIKLVQKEMIKRNYKIKIDIFTLLNKLDKSLFNNNFINITTNIFPDWHNDRYFLQCYYNLQEKFDCHGISQNDWKKIDNLLKKKHLQVLI